jgi:hypothetical protein
MLDGDNLYVSIESIGRKLLRSPQRRVGFEERNAVDRRVGNLLLDLEPSAASAWKSLPVHGAFSGPHARELKKESCGRTVFCPE